MLYIHDRPKEYFALSWSPQDAAHLGAVPGDPSRQSMWEFLTLALALCQWAKPAGESIPLAVLGDNTAALQDALSLTGSFSMRAIAKEIAWRQARFNWQFEVGHLLAEANHTSDALSRLDAPEPAVIPRVLRRASRVTPMPLQRFWQVQAGPPTAGP